MSQSLSSLQWFIKDIALFIQIPAVRATVGGGISQWNPLAGDCRDPSSPLGLFPHLSQVRAGLEDVSNNPPSQHHMHLSFSRSFRLQLEQPRLNPAEKSLEIKGRHLPHPGIRLRGSQALCSPWLLCAIQLVLGSYYSQQVSTTPQ